MTDPNAITITVTLTHAQIDEMQYAISLQRGIVRDQIPSANPHRAQDLRRQDCLLAGAANEISRAAGLAALARITAMNARAAYAESDVPAWMLDRPVELD